MPNAARISQNGARHAKRRKNQSKRCSACQTRQESVKTALGVPNAARISQNGARHAKRCKNQSKRCAACQTPQASVKTVLARPRSVDPSGLAPSRRRRQPQKSSKAVSPSPHPQVDAAAPGEASAFRDADAAARRASPTAERLRKLFRAYSGATDLPTAAFPDELLAAFPDAKFARTRAGRWPSRSRP